MSRRVGRTSTTRTEVCIWDGRPIRRLRQECGLTLKQIAAAMGYASHSQASKVERACPGNGPVTVPFVAFRGMAERLGEEVEELCRLVSDGDFDAPDGDKWNEGVPDGVAFSRLIVRRLASPTDPDLDGFLRLYRRAALHRRFSGVEIVRRLALQETDTANDSDVLLVAKRGGRAVGFLWVRLDAETHTCVVEDAAVDPSDETASDHAMRLLFQYQAEMITEEGVRCDGFAWRIPAEASEAVEQLRVHAVAWGSRLAGRPTDVFVLEGGDQSVVEFVPIGKPDRKPAADEAERIRRAVRLSIPPEPHTSDVGVRSAEV
ncbi:MAG: helix-turn-helix transcriptional regulator [Candidatus Poribacteria bacterium]|nr:helix-turn-helix transcriptional regulator [Candidatus Poribacteria bacterium]